jgi:hypothetical protein
VGAETLAYALTEVVHDFGAAVVVIGGQPFHINFGAAIADLK